MTKFEYIVLDDCIDDEPTEESVLEQIEERSWTYFESVYCDDEFTAEEIVEKHHADWEIFDEDDGVYIAIRESGKENFRVYRASLFHTIGVRTDCIYSEDDFKEGIM